MSGNKTDVCEASNEQRIARHSSRITAGRPPKRFTDEFAYHHYAFNVGQIDEPFPMHLKNGEKQQMMSHFLKTKHGNLWNYQEDENVLTANESFV